MKLLLWLPQLCLQNEVFAKLVTNVSSLGYIRAISDT